MRKLANVFNEPIIIVNVLILISKCINGKKKHFVVTFWHFYVSY